MAEGEEGVEDQGLGNDGGESTQASWRDGIDDAYRNDPAFNGMESFNDLAKAHVNAQELIGRKGVIKPIETDSPEIHAKYREDMGIPTSAEGYTLEGFDPSISDVDEDFLGAMRGLAHSVDISDTDFTKMVNGYSIYSNEIMSERNRVAGESTEEGIKGLRTEWGAAYEANRNLGEVAMSQLTDGSNSDITQLPLADGTVLGNHPGFMKIMAKVGKNMTEKGLIGDKPVNNHGLSPEEANLALESMYANQEQAAALFDSSHLGHKLAVQERDRLLQFAFPDDNG